MRTEEPVFGPNQLPKLAKMVGKSAKSLKDGMEGTLADDDGVREDREGCILRGRVDRRAWTRVTSRSHAHIYARKTSGTRYFTAR